MAAKRDFCFVKDGAEGHIHATLLGSPGDVYVYGSGENISTEDWYHLIIRVGQEGGHWGRLELRLNEAERGRVGFSEVQELRVDFAKLHALSGWRPRHGQQLSRRGGAQQRETDGYRTHLGPRASAPELDETDERRCREQRQISSGVYGTERASVPRPIRVMTSVDTSSLDSGAHGRSAVAAAKTIIGPECGSDAAEGMRARQRPARRPASNPSRAGLGGIPSGQAGF